ncbi:hypothetical protein PENTCL1PPCAC_26895, partial [Pristionchus entomophagus]
MALYPPTSRYGSPLMTTTGHDGLHVWSVLLNEHIWSSAFSKKRRERATRWAKILGFGQILYEKLRIHYLLPVFLLIAYSLAGGGIFYLIESSPESELLAQKSKFMSTEKDGLRLDVEEIQEKVSALQETYANNSVALNRHVRGYRKFALNQLHKRVYWYALSAYYLTEQETHKQQALRPRNTEPLWRQTVYSTFGRIYALRNYTEQLALRCWEIGVENRDEKWTRTHIHNAIERFDTLTGLNHVLTPVWTFWNAMLLAVTTYTTIGYGNITAKSRSGQLAVMLYAVVGIPLVLMILHKLGRLSLTVLAIIYQKMCRLFNTLIGSTVLSQDITPTEIPLPFAIGVAFGWMFLCAGIYLHFEEDWDYFKSFYFFFCSLTTIGYGDVTPTNSEDMFMIIILLLIGLSLVSMCINVIQLKLEKFFEEILLSVIEEYSSNPEARALRGDKIGFLDMWRVWKKRKARLREQAKASKQEAGEKIARVLPFARRRERQELIREIKQRLRQLDKSTQTERIVMYSIGCEPVFAPDRVPYLAPDNDRRKFAPLKHLLIPSIAAPEAVSPFVRTPESPSDTFAESTMRNSTLPSSSYHPPISIFSPQSEWGSLPSVDQASNHSIPKVNRSVLPPDFNPARRWTFVETGKLGRGMPRGLINPMALTRGIEHRRESETARLLAEIDRNFVAARRELSTPSPYTTSVSGLTNSRRAAAVRVRAERAALAAG